MRSPSAGLLTLFTAPSYHAHFPVTVFQSVPEKMACRLVSQRCSDTSCMTSGMGIMPRFLLIFMQISGFVYKGQNCQMVTKMQQQASLVELKVCSRIFFAGPSRK